MTPNHAMQALNQGKSVVSSRAPKSGHFFRLEFWGCVSALRE
jgi:hypothetical protein